MCFDLFTRKKERKKERKKAVGAGVDGGTYVVVIVLHPEAVDVVHEYVAQLSLRQNLMDTEL